MYGGFEYDYIETKKAILNHKYENQYWTYDNSIELSKIVDRIIEM